MKQENKNLIRMQQLEIESLQFWKNALAQSLSECEDTILSYREMSFLSKIKFLLGIKK